MFCQNCGGQIPSEESRFCPGCGKATDGSTNSLAGDTSNKSSIPKTEKYVPERKKSSAGKILGIIVLVFFLVIILVGVVWFMSTIQEKKDNCEDWLRDIEIKRAQLESQLFVSDEESQAFSDWVDQYNTACAMN